MDQETHMGKQPNPLFIFSEIFRVASQGQKTKNLFHSRGFFRVSNDDLLMDKSSHRRCSVRKDVFRNFAKFTGKKPVLESPFQKRCRSPACSFIKKRLWHRCFPNFFEISRNIFSTERLQITDSEWS